MHTQREGFSYYLFYKNEAFYIVLCILLFSIKYAGNVLTSLILLPNVAILSRFKIYSISLIDGHTDDFLSSFFFFSYLLFQQTMLPWIALYK